MVRREAMDGKPPTKCAPHATANEWRAGRRDVPPPMTSQALTISARHTSSTVPTRPRRRHSLRDNERRAIVRALIAEVRRPFLSHHSTRQSIALVAGAIPRGTLPPRAAHTMVRSRGTAGTRTNDASPKGVSAHHLPLERRDPGRALARPLHPPRGNPQPLRDATARSSRARRPELATDGRTTCDRGRTHCAPGTSLANMGARIARPERNLRTWARTSRALESTCGWVHASCSLPHHRKSRTCEHGRAHRAPRRKLANVGARIARPERNLRMWAPHRAP